jgi:pilus assembly protein CpaC
MFQFMLLWLFLYSPPALAQNDIHLELGEHKQINQKFSKIWIENPKIAVAELKNNKFYLKSLNTGITYYRLDNNLFRVVVSPIGSHQLFKDWSAYKNNFVNLRVSYCREFVCLKGQLYRLKDYIRIREYNSKVLIALEVADNLKPDLQKYLETELRKKSVTPLKIQFAEPWTIYANKSKAKSHISEVTQTFGILSDFKSENTDIGENIKISVKIVEISKNFERKIGLRWPDSYQAQILDYSTLAPVPSFDLALNAAEKSGDAKILASPNLICRSGKEADFFAGGEFPIKVLGLRSKEIQWKRYGIALKLKPVIDPLAQMSLQVETEISTLDRSISVDDVPALHSNRVSSYFDLIHSKTIVLSGLIKSESSENNEGIPWLKNIPVLGSLFNSKNFLENKSELVIFVTPELME